MSHVGVEGFAAGHGQEYGAERDEAGPVVPDEEANAGNRAQRCEHFWGVHDPVEPE